MDSKFAIVTLESRHTGFADETNIPIVKRLRSINFFPDQVSMEKFEDELQSRCDDVYNYQTLWKGDVQSVLDRTIGASLREKLKDDDHNTTACDVLNEMLEIPGVANAILSTVPDDWECNSVAHTDDPTKKTMAFQYIWEKFQEEIE